MCVCCKGGAAAAPLYNIFSPPPLTCLATSPSQNVSCFNLVQTPPWWIACSINLDCFFKLFPSSPSPCVNKLSNPLISAGTRYHLTSLPPFPFFFFFLLFSHQTPRHAKFLLRLRENSLTSYSGGGRMVITYGGCGHGHAIPAAQNDICLWNNFKISA